MKRNPFFVCLIGIFLILFIFWPVVSGYASLQGRDNFIKEDGAPGVEKEDADRADHLQSIMKKDMENRPDLMQWNLDVDNKTFQVTVNRNDETITIRGEAEDWEQKDRAERVLKARAPKGFQIINEIDISQPSSTRGRG